jgi:uncharacterized Ntn-hydrolase superfamily protein
MTWSLIARDAAGAFGIAVATKNFAVGCRVPFIMSGVGAVATQALVNPFYGVRGLRFLQDDLPPEEIVKTLTSGDEGREQRQVHVMDRLGRVAAHTGKDCVDWCGHTAGEGFSVAGNMLAGPAVIEETAKAYKANDGLPFPRRLIAALKAGEAAGGDKRGRQSAALLVHNEQDYAYVNLRVDEHPSPVPELRRVFEVFKLQARPFLDGMPRRGALARPAPPDVTKMLLRPPRERPGGTGADLWTAFTGLDLPEARRDELLRAFAPIAAEIARLREVDLGDVHPAVVFDPRVDPS